MASNVVDASNRRVTPKAAMRAIRKGFKKRRPLFLWGGPGIGKSEIIHQIGDEMGAPVIDIRLSLWEPTDIRGIPYYNSTTDTMMWAAPSELPSKELAARYPYMILFLDEMNSAPPSVQAAAYQLILNRRVGTYELPDNVLIVAAGNREADRGVVYRMPSPLANRFIHLEMSVDFDDWISWAANNFIHPDVVGFISFSKKDLYDFDPRTAGRSFPTPRSWSFVSELLEDKDTDDATLLDLISGTIGEGLAVKFNAHRKFSSNLPTPTDILMGKVTELKTKEISAMHTLIVGLCYELKTAYDADHPDFNLMANSFFQFSMDNFEVEMVIMGIRLAMREYNICFDFEKGITSFEAFTKKYTKYLPTATR